MNQAALIQALCDDLTPVTPMPAAHRLVQGAVMGAGASLFALLAWIGVQPGLADGDGLAALLLKAGTLAVVAALAMRTLAALAQPGSPQVALLPGLAKVVAALGFVALGQMLVAHESGAGEVLFGSSWQSCPWRIAALSLPLLGGLFWALRQQAPVNLRRTGAIAGLCAGSIGAAIYALACTEMSAAFMLVWYGLGIGIATLAGMLAGPRLLRW